MTTFIKVDVLFATLGYSETVYRGQATRLFQKALKVSKEMAQGLDILTIEETKAILTDLAVGKSKAKLIAMDLLQNDKFLSIENVATEDDTYKIEKKAKAKKSKQAKKSDFQDFITENGLEDEFKEWFATRN